MLLRVMKITTFFLFVAFMQVSATGLAQKVTLIKKDVTLKELFKEINKQTGYNVFAADNLISSVKPFDANFKRTSLLEVLNKSLEHTQLSYTISDKNIVITAKEAPQRPQPATGPPQAVTVTGKVEDELGQPMVGVTVKQKDNTSNGTVTDAKGNYSISVPGGNTVVSFSYIGYDTQELKAKDIPGGSVIILKAAENNLHEVVVNKGYYYEKKELSTGDISVVSAKTIEQQPVSDPIQALIGQVAGLNIQQTSGVPGSYATIHIRGLNSIAGGNDPFYVVDGVPFSSVSLTDFGVQGGALGTPSKNPTFNQNSNGLSPFNTLNPDDIESIEVLKDADATAIYGSRGANGVILITTKKGKAGETKVSVDLQQGIGQVGHFMDMLHTQQYLQMREQAYYNDGLAVPSISASPTNNAYDVNGFWDSARYTNWQQALIGGTAHYSNDQASISGGNTNTQFVISGGYNRQTTVFPGDFGDHKASLHLSLTNTSSNQKFKAVFTASYVNENNVVPQRDLTSSITLAPNAPALYSPNGSLNWQLLNGTSTFANPLSYTAASYTSIGNNLVSNLNLSYRLLPGLVMSASVGYNHDELNQTNLLPATGYLAPPNNIPSNSGSEFATSYAQGWIIEPKLAYDKKIGEGHLNVLVSGSILQSSSQNYGNAAEGFNSDALIANPAAASDYFLADDFYNLYRYEALVARLGYTWKDKYLLNLTANRDGSSRFGPGKQFGNFGSIGAGWIFSKEKWMESAAPWLSFGKLRASYGTTGNDQIGNYQYLSTYKVSSTSYQGVTQLTPSNLPNADFAWEVDKKLEGGLELGFLKDRVDLSLSYYRNRTGNQLVGYPLPAISGFTTVEYNFPAVIQNTGLEAELHTTNIKTNNFTWSTSVNFTAPQNKLVSYPGIAGSPYVYSYAVGASLFSQQLYQYTGINPQTGFYIFRTNNGSGLPSNADRVSSLPVTQKYYGGIANDFSYKGFGLSVFVQFVNQMGYNYLHAINASPGSVNKNFPTAVLNAWQSPGQAGNLEKFSTKNPAQFSYYGGSTAAITDASFVRIKNAELYYRLPARWQSWAHTQNARIYIQGQNLYTFTKYIGLDPETQGLGLPPLRVIMAGLSASF